MTDKERADEYIKSKWSHLMAGTQAMVSTAYIDGMESGKPKWHDLRKYPNDLPTEKGDYWVVDANGYYSSVYIPVNGYGLHKALGIIAWFELPKFEEKAE